MDGTEDEAASSGLPTCSYCRAAPALSHSMEPPLCLGCRLWDFSERQEAIDEGRRTAEDEFRRQRQSRAAAAEYQRIMASAEPGTTGGLPRDMPPSLECLEARQQTLS